jgi:hypothetical protein
MKKTTEAVKGVVVEVRGAGFSWRATVRHLGGGGTDYEKFNGRWMPVFYDAIPRAVYRQLRTKLHEAARLSYPV